MRCLTVAAVVLVVALAAIAGFSLRGSSHFSGETVYVVNNDSKDISDKQIRHDIPAWEQAANKDLARYWDTPQVHIVLVSHAPAGGIEALIVKDGREWDALAFHKVNHGVPEFIVYAAKTKEYHFAVSLAFTHELFEMLVDPYTAAYQLPLAGLTIQEICDPVEQTKDSYLIDGVRISDFVTPRWFGDYAHGRWDFMRHLHKSVLLLPTGV